MCERPFSSVVPSASGLHRFGPYYTEPVIAGLDPKTFKPFICSLDLIGCPMVTDDFVVSGTCSEQMYGMCESLWEPNMVSRGPGGVRPRPAGKCDVGCDEGEKREGEGAAAAGLWEGVQKSHPPGPGRLRGERLLSGDPRQIFAQQREFPPWLHGLVASVYCTNPERGVGLEAAPQNGLEPACWVGNPDPWSLSYVLRSVICTFLCLHGRSWKVGTMRWPPRRGSVRRTLRAGTVSDMGAAALLGLGNQAVCPHGLTAL